MDRALIVRKPHIDNILDNGKCWEMRSRPTRITGWIGLIEAGSGLIVGKAFLTSGHVKPSADEISNNTEKHQVKDLSQLEKWCYSWTLEKAERFEEPIPYDHPNGAVIWVKI